MPVGAPHIDSNSMFNGIRDHTKRGVGPSLSVMNYQTDASKVFMVKTVFIICGMEFDFSRSLSLGIVSYKISDTSEISKQPRHGCEMYCLGGFKPSNKVYITHRNQDATENTNGNNNNNNNY